MATTPNSVPASGGGTENGLHLQQHQRQVVHVRENSDTAMEDLFSVINDPTKVTSTFRQKNLPKSFFMPPDPSRSSRENLLLQQQQQEMGQFGGHPGLVPQHSRSRSSPAQLPNSLSMQQQQQQPSHRAQHSVDYTEELQMPSQWADRNHRYMLNSPNNQQQQQQGSATASPANSQWSVNAQKSLSSGNLVEANNNNPSALSPASSSHGPSPATSLQNLSLSTPPPPHTSPALLNLPQGWDISLTADNEIYYINHCNKTTSWYHPTLRAAERQHQGPGPMKLTQLPLAQQQLILQQQAVQQQAQQLQQQQQQLSPQQQQQLTPRGGRPAHQHSNSTPSPSTTSSSTTSNGCSSNNNNGVSEQHIYMELQRLQKEKERLQREQEDITRKERLLQTNIGRPGQTSPPSSSSSSSTPSSTPSSSSNNPHLSIIGEEPGNFHTPPPHNSTSQQQRAFQELMLKKDLLSPVGSDSLMHQQQTPASVGIDPFLGQAAHSQSSTATVESHARQNSADSGLGGMGTNYSLPRTPEDFLSNVEEMDSSNDGVVGGGQKLLKHTGGLGNGIAGLSAADFGMDTSCGGGHSSMDIGALGDVGEAAMSDDLVSSLQDEMMTSDLLNDVDIQKDLLMNPTWL